MAVSVLREASVEEPLVDPRLADAALRCIARWGVGKTTFDDIAREAGVGRATVYRAFPGGKERLVTELFRHEVARFATAVEADLRGARTLEDLVTTGVCAALQLVTDHAALRYLLTHEPEVVLSRLAFHRLDPVLAAMTELCRPHLARFLPDDRIRPAAELLTRIVLSFGFNPSDAVDPHDAASVRRLVHTYLLPAFAPYEETS